MSWQAERAEALRDRAEEEAEARYEEQVRPTERAGRRYPQEFSELARLEGWVEQW